MTKVNQRHQKILLIFLENQAISSSGVFSELSKIGEELALVTVKRMLSQMAKLGLVVVSGSGPSTAYEISVLGRLVVNVDAKKYCAIEPDRRYGLSSYNFELFPALSSEIFLENELKKMEDATAEYRKRTSGISSAIHKKEIERLVIELSWKSSKIEGNTYTLLDTEKLILENKEAVGHSKEEAVMILNHKNAFNFIHESKTKFKTLSRSNLEELHSFVVKDLNVGLGLRKKPVGVLGSKYKPLDNVHQVNDAVEELSRAVSRMETPYAKALIALLGISYIQPFEDGNKRTSRLMADALLLAHNCAPLSYRSIDEAEYREAMLVFYEVNSLIPFKKIFIEQYDFAAHNYSAK